MKKMLHLTKVKIRNFRSIDKIEINNIGDIMIFVGPNEAGKSNILKALKWFGSDEKMNRDDIPVRKKGELKSDEEIVTCYFKISDIYSFEREFKKTMNAKKLKNNIINDEIKNIDTRYLKIIKCKNGKHLYRLIEDDGRCKNLLSDLNLEQTIDKYFTSFLNSLLINNGIKLQEKELEEAINKLKDNDEVNSYIGDFYSIIQEYHDPYWENFIVNNKDIENKISKLERRMIEFNPIPSKRISFDMANVLMQTYARFEGDLISVLESYESSMKNMCPEIILLDENQNIELKGIIEKQNTWKQTLDDKSKKYQLNRMLFKILNIDIENFDKMDVEDQDDLLDERINRFSRQYLKIWKQEKLRIESKVMERKIKLRIVELDKKTNEIVKKTPPENRSQGFKWFLTHIIILEYMKKESNAILLLDDPGVFLHEKGQKHFLEEMNKISKHSQIIYNTHLISLFDEKHLERVYLVNVDENHNTGIQKPWGNNKDFVISPIYYALGIDKLIFEKTDKVLFVEGISDKFILEGIKAISDDISDWYIHPLSGGDAVDENDIVKKVKMLNCLVEQKDIDYYFILDGDKKDSFEKISKDIEIPKTVKKQTLFLGNSKQEIEDLIERDFYLNCILETYEEIFLDNSEKIGNLIKIIEDIKNKKPLEGKLIKDIEDRFEKEGLEIKNISKSAVATTIKRKLENGDIDKKSLEEIIKVLNKIKN